MASQPDKWRIRLPNDYLVQPGLQSQISSEAAAKINKGDNCPTLDDWSVILEAQTRFAACRAAEDMIRQNCLADLLFSGYVPPSKWRRRWDAMKRFPRRVRDAWKVLTGEAQVYDDDY